VIVTESELVNVLLKVLRTNTVMRAIDRPLKLAPKAFDGVGVDIATDVFFAPVVDLAVLVTEFRGVAIDVELIRTEHRSAIYVAGNVGEDIGSRHPIYNFGNHLTVTLDNADNRSFASGPAPALAGTFPADVSLIRFHNAHELRWLAVYHEFADLMGHAPRRLVRDTKLALKLFSGHAILAARHEENGKEPTLEAGSRFVEDRASGRVNLMPAPLTRIAATFFDGMKAIGLAAFRAGATSRILNLKHEVEARPVVGELCVELF